MLTSNDAVYAHDPTALVLYEHMISVQQEYQVIWRRKFSVPMVLFVVNWYLLVIHSVLFILWYLMWFENDVVSDKTIHTGMILTLLLHWCDKRYAA